MRPVELDYQLWLPANLAPPTPHMIGNQRYILTEPCTPIPNLRPTAASRSFPDFKAEVIWHLSGTRNNIGLGGLLHDLGSEGALDWCEIPCGGRVPPSLAITADSETATIAYLHHQILEELGSMNITFPAKCLGYRQINMIKTPDNMLLKNILGINQHPKIVFEVKFKTCNGTTERNAGALAAIVGAAAGPVISTGIIKAMGFQAAGILAGSPAAAWMVSIGAVQAGSLVAVFQSIGAVGLGPLGIVGMMSLALDLVRGEQKQVVR
ncbi:hypothetical protein MJO29_008092 [Puccinia striiformis f. sp. tritici]|nr:hypothetical protein MJO29_008092 [Puccinia striiformis f. sp. tritici]